MLEVGDGQPGMLQGLRGTHPPFGLSNQHGQQELGKLDGFAGFDPVL